MHVEYPVFTCTHMHLNEHSVHVYSVVMVHATVHVVCSICTCTLYMVGKTSVHTVTSGHNLTVPSCNYTFTVKYVWVSCFPHQL